MTEIISRSEAKKAGLKRFFTGEPCKRGHVAERLVSNARCLCCYRGNQRSRRKENPEKIREIERRSHKINSEKILESQRRRRKENPEQARESERRRRKENPEKFREADRRRRKENPEKKREADRRWYAKRCCAKIFASIDRGFETSKAAGILLDINTAVDVFKTADNAFEFVDALPETVKTAHDTIASSIQSSKNDL